MNNAHPPTCISARAIARKTGHSAMAIHYRIKNMGIQPAMVTTEGRKFYDPAVVESLVKVMRGPWKNAAK